VLGELLAIRGFEFAVERAVFASVLHRLFVSGSPDRYFTSGVSKISWINCQVTLRFGLQPALSWAAAHPRTGVQR
jgi:hypothetical protein